MGNWGSTLLGTLGDSIALTFKLSWGEIKGVFIL